MANIDAAVDREEYKHMNNMLEPIHMVSWITQKWNAFFRTGKEQLIAKSTSTIVTIKTREDQEHLQNWKTPELWVALTLFQTTNKTPFQNFWFRCPMESSIWVNHPAFLLSIIFLSGWIKDSCIQLNKLDWTRWSHSRFSSLLLGPLKRCCTLPLSKFSA